HESQSSADATIRPDLGSFLSALEQAFHDRLGVTTSHITLAGAVAALSRGCSIVSVLDLDERHEPLVTSWTAGEFAQFQSLLGIAGHLLWLTRGAHMLGEASSGAMSDRSLKSAPTTGLLRVLRNEYRGLAIGHLDFSSPLSSPSPSPATPSPTTPSSTTPT